MANWPKQQRGTRGVYVTSSLLNHLAEFEFFICDAVVVVVVGVFQHLLKVCTHVFSFIQQEQQQQQPVLQINADSCPKFRCRPPREIEKERSIERNLCMLL